MTLKIEYVTTADLIPYALNSRTHSERQVAQIAASIQEFGFTNPVLVDESGSIIAGHGRIEAANLLNLAEVPTISLLGLSEAQKKAYVIADNKLALNAGWNDELLKVELEALSEVDFNLEILGWDTLPDFNSDIDYSILEEDSLEGEVDLMSSEVKKAIQIEFESQDYDEATELIKFWRTQGAYVGALIIEHLRNEKSKL
jgi:hypothetical protein